MSDLTVSSVAAGCWEANRSSVEKKFLHFLTFSTSACDMSGRCTPPPAAVIHRHITSIASISEQQGTGDGVL